MLPLAPHRMQVLNCAELPNHSQLWSSQECPPMRQVTRSHRAHKS
jgi:hypothetical protein